MSKRLFFSPEGLDWHDDDAIAAFAERVWLQAVTEFTEDPEEPTFPDNTESQKENTDD